MKYEEIGSYTKAEAEAALIRNNPAELTRVVIGIGLHTADFDWAESYCMKLVGHPDEYVRGDTILAFAHLARRGAALDETKVKPIVQNALKDGSTFVRGHAHDTVEDIVQFLGWRFA